MNISFILTTRNTLPYTKLAYESIRKYNPTVEIVMLDDASTDGTLEWIDTLVDDNLIKWKNPDGKQYGHTITYNIGAKLATKENICIFHSDMVCTENFVPNLLKHIKPKTIVSGTRIEPPVYPGDDAKILKDFGIYIDDFKETEFNEFVKQQEQESKDKTTPGFFAPWTMNRQEYIDIGGMDKLFRPYPIEDSDFVNRLFLAGYDIVQSRDSLCYHWASRAHRWTTGKVQIDTDEFKQFQQRAMINFYRKWGTYPKNNAQSYPIVNNKYDIGFVIKVDEKKDAKFVKQLFQYVEPWCMNVYTNMPPEWVQEYIQTHQKNTDFDLKKKIRGFHERKNNDILVHFNWMDFVGHTPNTAPFYEHLNFLTLFSDILKDSGELGVMVHDIFKIDIRKLGNYEKHFINVDDKFYQQQLIRNV